MGITSLNVAPLLDRPAEARVISFPMRNQKCLNGLMVNKALVNHYSPLSYINHYSPFIMLTTNRISHALMVSG